MKTLTCNYLFMYTYAKSFVFTYNPSLVYKCFILSLDASPRPLFSPNFGIVTKEGGGLEWFSINNRMLASVCYTVG